VDGAKATAVTADPRMTAGNARRTVERFMLIYLCREPAKLLECSD
jgi:hypothetical protein